jgi:tetratricopeptide (TPR) repeat protein
LLRAQDFQEAASFLNVRNGREEHDQFILGPSMLSRIKELDNQELLEAAERLIQRIATHLKEQRNYSGLVDFFAEQLKDADRAVQQIDEVIEQAGDSVSASMYCYRASIHRRHLQQAEAAVTDYEKALEIDPESFQAHADLASVLIELEQPDRAFFHARRSIEVSADAPKMSLWFTFANAARDAGRLSEALKFVTTERQFEPHKWDEWEFLAFLHLFSGDREGYRETCERMLREGQVLSGFVLAPIPDAVVDYRGVIEKWKLAYKTGPTHFGHHRSLTAALYRAGRYDEVVTFLDPILRDQPPQKLPAVAHCALFYAMAKYRLGKLEEAKQDLAAARQNRSQWKITAHKWWHHEPLWQMLENEASTMIEAGSQQSRTGNSDSNLNCDSQTEDPDESGSGVDQ